MKSEIEVPNGWQLIKISDVSKTYAGGTPSRYNKSFFNGDILWVKSGEVDGQFIEETSERITEEALQKSSAKIIPENTVLIAMYGATAGKVGFLKKEGASNQAVLAIPNNKVNFNSLFMYYLLSSQTVKIMKTTQGTGQPNLSKTLVERTEILLPTLKEQQKIADILSKVDEQIDLTEKIIDKTEEMKKGLMQKLLTKGIGHTKFKKTELGEIPEEWRIRKLNKSTEINPNYNLTKNKEYDYIPMDSVSENFNGLKYLNRRVYNNSSGSKIKKGDIIFAKITPCIENGKIAIINELNTEYAIGSTEFFVFSPFNFLDSTFLFYQLCSEKLHQKAINLMEGTTGRQRVNKNVFGHSKILIPSLNEQKHIASILSKVDEQIQDNKKELNHLQELKKGIMQDLLTGKVRVIV